MKKYNLLVPMAGMGKRFTDAGYRVPKQLLYVRDKQTIDISLSSVEIKDCNLIFILRDDQVFNFHLDKILEKKYGKDIKIISIDKLTEGSVCSCLYAREYIDNDLPLIIHTLDIQCFPVFDPEYFIKDGSDGMLLTFKSNSKNYSYVSIDSQGIAIKTAEKKVISQNACVGIYCFKKGSDFCKYADDMIAKDLRTNKEFYISPLYNLLIQDNMQVKTLPVEKMHIFGTPYEFEFYKNNVVKEFGEKPIALCSDHSGYIAKENFKSALKRKGINFIDFGTKINTDCDYSYFIEQAVTAMQDKVCDFSLAFCRTGQGVNICANKFKSIRSALIYDEFSAEMSIRHNCANFFSIPARFFEDKSSFKKIESLIDIFLSNTFDGGRHQARVQGIKK